MGSTGIVKRAALVAALLAVVAAGGGGAAASAGAANPAANRARNCTPGYKPCIPNKPSDVDCYGGGGNGPRYTKPGVVYTVWGSDRYGLDADNDGKGCE